MALKRTAILAALAAAVIAAFVWALRPQPVPVDLAEIRRGMLEITVADEGVARITEVYSVSSPIAGRIRRTLLDPGDLVVRQETIVATVEPVPPGFLDTRSRREIAAEVEAARSALRLAEAEVTRAEAEVTFWRSELARQERLRERGTISERAAEEARMHLAVREATLATAKAAVAVREGEVRRAEAHLIEPEEEGMLATSPCCLHLRAPATGRVLEVMVESETVVQAGQPILSIGDPASKEIVVDLLSSDAVRIENGARAEILRWGGPPLAARVRRIEPSGFEKVSALGIDEQRVRVRLELTSPPEDWIRLGHDYRVFVRITAERHEDVPLVPVGALFRDGRNWAVFVAEDGSARLRPFVLGAMNDRQAAVAGGLEVGARVILHPSDRINDGVAIVERPAR